MRTKNRKWIGPVPIALVAVFALAAFLSVGFLLVGNYGQVAEAQDASCKVTVEAEDTNNIPNPNPLDQTCRTTDNPVTVSIPGSLSTASTAATKAWVYARDGSIAGGSSVRLSAPGETVEGTVANPAPLAVTSAIVLDLPAATYNLSIAAAERAMPEVIVTPNSGKSVVTLYIYYETAPTSENFNHDGDDTTDPAKVLPIADPSVAITFLGMPALGKDLPGDFNKKLDDEVLPQCIVTGDTRMRLVDEGAGCAAGSPEGTTWEQLSTTTDQTETRSKLVVRTGLANETQGAATQLIDGKMATHTLRGTEATVTIYALVEDAAGRPLQDTEVSFSATTTPSGIVATRDLADEVDTKEVVTSSATLDEDGSQIRVQGLATATDIVPDTALITADNAVAVYTLTKLPIKVTDAYRITVEVMVDGLNLGTVVLERPGKPTVLKAGVFNVECLVDNNDTKTPANYADDNVGPGSRRLRRQRHGEQVRRRRGVLRKVSLGRHPRQRSWLRHLLVSQAGR